MKTLTQIARDERIAASLKTLQANHRGRVVLRMFKDMALQGGAVGLDTDGQAALVCLTRELTFGGARDFLNEIDLCAKCGSHHYCSEPCAPIKLQGRMIYCGETEL